MVPWDQDMKQFRVTDSKDHCAHCPGALIAYHLQAQNVIALIRNERAQ